ncbi:moulting cycle domain-containing protein [Ditylenchus destructor]|nr:moulting cycle domain-containing protein [Ditylenchus destructor]
MNYELQYFLWKTGAQLFLAGLAVTSLAGTVSLAEVDYTFGGKAQIIPMKNEQGMELVQDWINKMLGSFMATYATHRLKDKPKHIVDEFGDCNKHATNIPLQAKCVSRLLKDQITGKKYIKPKQNGNPQSSRLLAYSTKNDTQRRRVKKSQWVGGLRVKRSPSIVSRTGYDLKSPDSGKMTPLGGVAHMLMKAVLAAKNKTETRPWQETVIKITDSNKRRKEIRRKLEEESLENMEQFAFRGMKDRGMVQDDLNDVFEDPEKLKKFLSKKRSEKSKEPVHKLMGLLRQGLKIGYTLAGKNTSDFDDKTLKIASPRFLSVVPEEEGYKNETIDFISPSLFSLHNEGKGVENLTSLPSLMKGFSGKDQQEWMNLIMEAAGVVEQADRLEEDYKNIDKDKASQMRKRFEIESKAKDGTPLYFTRDNATKFGKYEERKIDTHMNLMANLTKEQVKDLNRTGYVLLTPAQLHTLYGPQSPYNNSEALKRFSGLKNISDLHSRIESDIHHTAQLSSFKIRQKDIVLSPISFTWITLNPALVSQSVVLSPVIFSPVVLSPSVLGPLILSPIIFSPIILSPRVLAPIILSPLAFIPFVLTPVVMMPIILSPGVFVPVILSPVVLSPFILSPQVFTPFVLSPFVLSPLILTPTAASPLVLSPFVLTPLILSPAAFSALVLSPYVLSPIIESKLIAFSVILSPSFLS